MPSATLTGRISPSLPLHSRLHQVRIQLVSAHRTRPGLQPVQQQIDDLPPVTLLIAMVGWRDSFIITGLIALSGSFVYRDPEQYRAIVRKPSTP